MNRIKSHSHTFVWLCSAAVTVAAAVMFSGSIVCAEDWTQEQQQILDDLDKSYQTDPQVKLADEIIFPLAADSPLRAEIEKRLLAVLPTKDSTTQLFMLRQLYPLATNQSIPVLESLLNSPDDAVGQCARYALERLPGTAVDEVFARALPATTGTVQAGIASACGNRKIEKALPAIIELTKSADPEIAKAAVFALGNYGTAQGATVLQGIIQAGTAPLTRHAEEALLKTAEAIAATDPAQAKTIYKALITNPNDKMFWAAMAAMVRLGDEAACAQALELVAGENEFNANRAVSLIIPVTDATVLAKFAALCPKLPSARQVYILEALSFKTPDQLQGVGSIVEKLLTGTPDPGVAVAAITVLGTIGRADTLSTVLQAGDTEDKQVQRAVEAALLQIHDPNLAETLIGYISDPKRPIPLRCSAIRVLSTRKTDQSARILTMLQKLYNSEKDENLRSASLIGCACLARFLDDPQEVFLQMIRQTKSVAGQKQIIEAMGTNWQTFEGLDAAIEIMRTFPAIRPNAGLAAVRIGNTLRGADADRVAIAMKNVIREVKHDDIEKRAGAVLGEIDKYVGYIRTWAYNGPYQKENVSGDQLQNMEFGPEKDGTVKTEGFQWKPMTQGFNRWVWNLETAIVSTDNATAYLRTYVYSPKEQPIQLDGAMDDGMKVWINGVKVHEKYTPAPPEAGSHQATGTLKAGWNELVVKVTDASGGWEFALRIRNRNFEQIEDLKFQIEPK